MQSVVILGKKGWGKSFLHCRILAQYDHTITVNEMGDMEFVERPVSVDIQGLLNVRQIAAHFQVNMHEMAYKYHNPKQVFDTVCRFLALWGKAGCFRDSPIMLAIDEVQTYCDRYGLPYYLDEIVNKGRHWRIHYSVNTRRYPEIHKDLIGNANEFYAGPSMDINDMKRMEYIFGKDNVQTFLARNLQHAFLHKSDTDTVDIAIANPNGVEFHGLR